jgi:hypothetical protein
MALGSLPDRASHTLRARRPVDHGIELATASSHLEIRTIYQEVRQTEATGRLHTLQRTFEYCRSYEDTERVLYLDSGGVVRSYHYSGGSEDSTAQHAHYYDRHGKLRFVFVKAGAANGTGLEHRVYLSEAGKLVGGTKAPRSRLDISEPMAGERACQEPQACLRCGEPCQEAK